ncbi:MAG: OmpH family outer membrane protein [Pseudomonadota bacterium]
MTGRGLWLALCLAVLPFAAGAQDPVAQSQVLVIDQERLFSESQLGAAALSEIETAALELAAENRRIEAELLAEEQALTQQRAEMSPAEFSGLADAFDAKVQRLRDEQDTKSRALTRARDEAQQAFFGDVGGILSAIARERGAVVMLERRQVFLSVDVIDVTDEAIERINAALSSDPPPGAEAEAPQ